MAVEVNFKVAILSAFYPPSIGGMEKQLRLMGHILTKKGVRVTVHTSAVFTPPGVALETRGLLTVIRSGENLRSWSLAAAEWVRKHCDIRTILLVASLGADTSEGMRQAMQFARRSGARTIIRIPTSDHLARARRNVGAIACMGMADRYITNSIRTARSMSGTVDVVYVPSCLPSCERVPAHAPFPKKCSVAYYGRLAARKRVEVMAEIAKRLPKYIAVVVQGPAGYGEVELATEILQKLRKFGVRVLDGSIFPSREVSESLVYINPSSVEGCSSSLLEAMSRGSLPVVSDIPENKSVIGGLGRLCEHEPRAYVEAILEMIHHPNRHSIQRRLRHRIEAVYSLERVAHDIGRAVLGGW